MNQQIKSSGGELTRRSFLGSAALAVAGCASWGPRAAGRWYRGQLHCHTHWSDGNAFPEQAVACYKQKGYDFVSITDHNRLSMYAGQWRQVGKTPGGWPYQPTEASLANALARFPWMRTRPDGHGGKEVLVSSVGDMMKRFNESGRFLLIPGVEVTRTIGGEWKDPTQHHVHMTYSNLSEVIPSVKGAALVQRDTKGSSVSGLIRETMAEITATAAEKGCPPPLVTLCHPHWRAYDVSPQDLVDNPEVRFFEVCNNSGDIDSLPEFHHLRGYDNDRFWDVVNAIRARRGKRLLYGTATDDAHAYEFSDLKPQIDCQSGYSGNGWVRVRAEALTPESLFGAMDEGDFYACCGLELDDVSFDGRTLRVRTLPGETCTVHFIVTKRDFDERIVRTVQVRPKDGKGLIRDVPIYSDTIGQVVKTVAGKRGEAVEASYTLAEDDLYVRARIESERLSPFWTWSRKPRQNPMHPKFATAWTQPYR